MKRLFLALFACIYAQAEEKKYADIVQGNSDVWGNARLENIDSYGSGFGPLFGFFAWLALGAVLGAIVAFIGHYAIVGPKHFDHHAGKPIYAFNKFERLYHLVAAVAWAILVPTGLIMMFGEEFGGGAFVKFCKDIHGLATIAFAISVVPMFLLWFWRMLPRAYDIRCDGRVDVFLRLRYPCDEKHARREPDRNFTSECDYPQSFGRDLRGVFARAYLHGGLCDQRRHPLDDRRTQARGGGLRPSPLLVSRATG